jgi:ribosomal protein S18 acetylase RimI-like enzyme
MQKSLAIRPANNKDRQTIADIWTKCSLIASYNDPARDLDFARGKVNSDVIVGTIDDRVVATAMSGHDGHRGWLYYVAVDPDHRGRGFGAAIVQGGNLAA